MSPIGTYSDDQTCAEFALKHAIHMTAKQIDGRPGGLMDDMPRGSTDWKLTLQRGRQHMTVCWSQGPAITEGPDLPEVLSALAQDTPQEDAAFEDWASELGYDEDSRKAERVFRACVEQTKHLTKFLGPELLDELLYHTERE